MFEDLTQSRDTELQQREVKILRLLRQVIADSVRVEFTDSEGHEYGVINIEFETWKHFNKILQRGNEVNRQEGYPNPLRIVIEGIPEPEVNIVSKPKLQEVKPISEQEKKILEEMTGEPLDPDPRDYDADIATIEKALDRMTRTLKDDD